MIQHEVIRFYFASYVFAAAWLTLTIGAFSWVLTLKSENKRMAGALAMFSASGLILMMFIAAMMAAKEYWV